MTAKGENRISFGTSPSIPMDLAPFSVQLNENSTSRSHFITHYRCNNWMKLLSVHPRSLIYRKFDEIFLPSTFFLHTTENKRYREIAKNSYLLMISIIFILIIAHMYHSKYNCNVSTSDTILSISFSVKQVHSSSDSY